MKKHPIQKQQIIGCILGNIIMAVGVAITKIADFGIDPFNGSCMTISAAIGISFNLFVMCYNVILFTFEVIFGRHYIQIGTFFNWFICPNMIALCLGVMQSNITMPKSIPIQAAVLILGLLVICIGLAFYQTSDLGVAPYDSIALMICDHFPRVSYFAARMLSDLVCMAMILLLRGDFGVGTIITAFCLGPLVQFFTKHMAEPLLGVKKASDMEPA